MRDCVEEREGEGETKYEERKRGALGRKEGGKMEREEVKRRKKM